MDHRTALPTLPRPAGSSQDCCEKRLFQQPVISACHQPYGLKLLFNLTFPQKFAARKGHQIHTLSSNSLNWLHIISRKLRFRALSTCPGQHQPVEDLGRASAKGSYALHHGCPQGLSPHWGPTHQFMYTVSWFSMFGTK